MRLRAVLVPLVALSLVATAPRPALALPQAAAPTSTPLVGAPATPPAEDIQPDSPRASMKRFLELANTGEYAEAAAYLDVPEARKAEAPQLARKLKAVLDHQTWGKLDAVSPHSLGEIGDGLATGLDEVGTIPTPTGPEHVRLARRRFPDGTRWIFTQATVDHIDGWYGRLRDHWQQEWFPSPLLRQGPKDLLYWQWIALPVVFLLSLGAGALLGWASRLILARIFSKEVVGDNKLLARLGPPLTLIWAVFGVEMALPSLALFPPAQAFIDGLVRAGFFSGAVWFVARCVDIGGARLLDLPSTRANPAARSLVPLGRKTLKVALVIFALLAALSELGVAVGSLVAGLGIGGVAIALAAQKTMENLFGSLSIGVDQPFRVGDFVTVDTISGTVESIGLRSTRIRTLDRTVVTLPNGKLADMRIESFTERDRIKLAAVLALDRTCSAASVRAVVLAVREQLKNHPKIWPDVSVALTRISDASFDVEILAWFQTTSWDEFLQLREDTLLALLETVEKAGARLAGPPAPTPPDAPALGAKRVK